MAISKAEAKRELKHDIRRKEAHQLMMDIGALVEDQGGDPKALKKTVKRLRKLNRKLRGE